MSDRQRRDAVTGTGPGITGASGDFIDNTGGKSGIGGTGHEDEAGATGRHPDERTLPRQEDAMREADEGHPHAIGPSGSATGTIGGDPHAAPGSESDEAGRPGGGGSGAVGELPGSLRNVGAGNDRDNEHVHRDDADRPGNT